MAENNKERMLALREELTKAARNYYNGIESMSNFEYDAKFDELKALEESEGVAATERFTNKVGSSVEKASPLKKVEHEYAALSLGKTKSVDELIKEQSKAEENASVCLSWKLDGCTTCLTYISGELVLAATRGDGTVGQDITRNAGKIKGIPLHIDGMEYGEKLVVRGESFMTYADFDRVNTDGQFANPRNLASATITALDRTLLDERPITFQAFELVADNGGLLDTEGFAAQLDSLKELGFGVVEHKRVPVSEIKEEIVRWSEDDRIKNLGIPVDGLVVMHDNRAIVRDLEDTGHHPNMTKGMAFKWQDETMETVLRKIEWSPSRTGLLNPVAVFDTVELCGTKVSRASLHNVSYIESLNLKEGDRITVYKANMIIPQIAENLDRDKGRADIHGISCPCCHKDAVIEENNGVKTMVCENEKCLAKELGAFVRYSEKHGTNIEGLSEKTILMLMENGYLKDISDFYTLNEHPEIAKIPGFGKKSYDNLIGSIEKSKDMDLEHFLYACGIENIGRGQLKDIIGYIKNNYEELKEKYLKKDNESDGENMFYILIAMVYNNFDFTQIDGIGSVLSENFTKFIDDEFIFPMEEKVPGRYHDCLPYIEFTDKLSKAKTAEISDSAIAGKSFCITGKLEHFENRDAMVAFIEENGGKFVSSVSKNTDFLINNDVTSTSGKNKKAHDLKIPIISEDDFLEMIGDKERDR